MPSFDAGDGVDGYPVAVRCHRGYHRPFWEASSWKLHRGKYAAKRRQGVLLVVTLGQVRAVFVLR